MAQCKPLVSWTLSGACAVLGKECIGNGEHMVAPEVVLIMVMSLLVNLMVSILVNLLV